jgi:hypothetical protein
MTNETLFWLQQVICSAASNENFQRAATQAATAAKDAANAAKGAASAAANAAADAVKNLKVPDMAKLDIDIKKTLTWNFLAQLALTGVSWAIAFTTSHAAMAKVGATATALHQMLNACIRHCTLAVLPFAHGLSTHCRQQGLCTASRALMDIPPYNMSALNTSHPTPALQDLQPYCISAPAFVTPSLP